MKMDKNETLRIDGKISVYGVIVRYEDWVKFAYEEWTKNHPTPLKDINQLFEEYKKFRKKPLKTRKV